MKYNICDLNQNVVGDIELNDFVFGLEARSDVLARVVHWQLAKRRQGTHETKEIGDVRGSTKKSTNKRELVVLVTAVNVVRNLEVERLFLDLTHVIILMICLRKFVALD